MKMQTIMYIRFTIKNDVCSSNVVDGIHNNIIVV